MSWKLPFTINLKYNRLLQEINSLLTCTKTTENKNTSLLSGISGTLLFLHYCQSYKGNGGAKHCEKAVEKIFNDINNGFSYPSFAGGLTGITWVFQHLASNNFLEKDFVEPLLGLDQFITSNHEYEFVTKEHYDYLHGGLGYHLPMMNSHLRKQSISNTLQFLDRTAMRAEDGIAWVSTPKLTGNEKVINLSLSHGLASIIQILSKTHEYCIGEELKKCEELLNGAIQYLLSKKQNQNEVGSYFPSWVSEKHVPAYSRLAWCYGDLGIAMALLQAGRNTQNKEWEDIAIEILLYTANRRDLEENLVKDAGLCHGTSGIAHCFNRAYNYTNRIEFKDAATYWFDETLKMAIHEDGLAGFKTWRTNEHGGWVNEYGLLEGIAGIGLSLISAIAPIEPKWDECLLLS